MFYSDQLPCWRSQHSIYNLSAVLLRCYSWGKHALTDSHPVLKKNSMDTYPLVINSKLLPQPRTSPGSVAISSSGSSDQSQHFAPLTVAPSCWCLSESVGGCVWKLLSASFWLRCADSQHSRAQLTSFQLQPPRARQTKTGVWPGVGWWE